MRYVAIPLFIASISLTTFAQHSKEYRACSKKAKTQAELNACANREATHVDTELNRIYATLLSKAASQRATTSKITTAQKAWIVYRDAYIDAMYPAADKQAEYGSMYQMQADLLRSKLTQQQIAALKDLLQQYGN